MNKEKHIKNFTKFFLVGVVWTIFSIILMWILIDIWGMYGWLGSSIATIIVVVGRYFHYLFVKLIDKNFLKYIATNISFSISTVLLMSLFVDILGISAKISSPLVIGGLFILKFIVFNWIKLIP